MLLENYRAYISRFTKQIFMFGVFYLIFAVIMTLVLVWGISAFKRYLPSGLDDYMFVGIMGAVSILLTIALWIGFFLSLGAPPQP